MVEGEKRSYLKYVTSKKGKNREKEEDGMLFSYNQLQEVKTFIVFPLLIFSIECLC